MAKHFQPLAAILLFLALAMFAGGSDYSDLMREQNKYCDMIAAGAWPDYKGNAGAVCGNGRGV